MATAASVIVGLGRWGTSQAHSRELFDQYLDKTSAYMSLRYKKGGAGGLDGLLARSDAAASSLVFVPATNADTPPPTPMALYQGWTVGARRLGVPFPCTVAGIRQELVL